MTSITKAVAKSSELSSLNRGLDILDAIQGTGRLRASDIADLLDLALSTVYRYVNALREAGYVIDIDGYLIPSARFVEPTNDSTHLVRYAAPVLNRMRNLSQMTALLTVRVNTAAMCLEAVFAHPQHKISFQRGQTKALYAGASALPLLAFAPPRIIKEVLGGDFRRVTAATPGRVEVEREIERVRKEGHSVSHGHVTPGMTGFGVPVIIDGQCICVLSLVGTPSELTAIEDSIDIMRAGARELVGRIPKHAIDETWETTDD
ncbi:Transcriptional regulator, IclR family [Leifsonia rubra CMS 76R]|nr:Transcriptional regulator, IclR family [Leifsonia rubra CMS 76R]